jgi:molybdate transport system regulatory protein
VVAVKTLKPRYKLWLETEGGYLFGLGAFDLLQAIQASGSLSAAVKTLKMSYRYAWGIIKQIEKNIGEPVLNTYKGGKAGGGGSDLTPMGQELLAAYSRFKKAFDELCTTEILNLSNADRH